MTVVMSLFPKKWDFFKGWSMWSCQILPLWEGKCCSGIAAAVDPAFAQTLQPVNLLSSPEKVIYWIIFSPLLFSLVYQRKTLHPLGDGWSRRNFVLTCMKPMGRASAESKHLDISNVLSFRARLILKLSWDLLQYCPFLGFSPDPVEGLVFIPVSLIYNIFLCVEEHDTAINLLKLDKVILDSFFLICLK